MKKNGREKGKRRLKEEETEKERRAVEEKHETDKRKNKE